MKFLILQAFYLETNELVDRLISLMRPALKDSEVVHCRDMECASKEIEDADAMFCYRITPELLSRAKKLKWIQFGSAGIDHTLFPELLKRDITLTTFSGVHPPATAEHVLALMLALSRRLQVSIRQQVEHRWDRAPIAGLAGELRGQTVGIVGLGKIGQEIAHLCKCFGMRVVGTKASPGALPDVDEVLPPSKLDRVLQVSDYLVLVVPLTTTTTALLGPREIGMMKRGASLVNVARGQMVDNGALIAALESGKLAGAALDVFYPEPLPENNPLWDAPNVIITPHTGGSTPHYAERGAEIVARNAKAFLSGGDMVNVFNRVKGY